MALDKKVSQAIRDAVAEEGQSAGLATRLIAWMDAVTSGNEDAADMASAVRHLEVLYAETEVEMPDEEDE